MIRQHDVVLARTDLAHAGLDGEHHTKARPCVVVSTHEGHLHVIPLTSRERPLRLSTRLPGSRRASKLIPVVLEVRREDLYGQRIARLCVTDALRVEAWIACGQVHVAPPRWCQPAPAPTSRDTAAGLRDEMLDPPPVTVPAHEAMAMLAAKRQARCTLAGDRVRQESSSAA